MLKGIVSSLLNQSPNVSQLLPPNSTLLQVDGADSKQVVEMMKKASYLGLYEPYIKQLYREYLEGEEPDQPKKIFNYAYQSAHFDPDPRQKQWIRTAGRVIKDGYANCVDYSVIISTFLLLCDIPHSFRRVKIGGSKNYVHIYVVLDDGTPLDCVIGQREDGQEETLRVNKYGSFGDELPYDRKHDTKVL